MGFLTGNSLWERIANVAVGIFAMVLLFVCLGGLALFDLLF